MMSNDTPVDGEAVAAIRRAIDASVPYIAKHSAFLIPQENWNELAAIAYPQVRKLDAAFAKMDRGETLTAEEIREILEE